MKQRYKNRIAYLYPKKPRIKSETVSFADSDTHVTEGIPFYCNVIEKNRRVEIPLSNTYKTVTETILKTDAELSFTEHDRITFQEYPENGVNNEDFSMIVEAVKYPRFEKGSKYRNNDVYTWEIKIS
jgi:hypothetical protein